MVLTIELVPLHIAVCVECRQRLAEMQKKVDESSDKCTFDSRAGRYSIVLVQFVGLYSAVCHVVV